MLLEAHRQVMHLEKLWHLFILLTIPAVVFHQTHQHQLDHPHLSQVPVSGPDLEGKLLRPQAMKIHSTPCNLEWRIVWTDWMMLSMCCGTMPWDLPPVCLLVTVIYTVYWDHPIMHQLEASIQTMVDQALLQAVDLLQWLELIEKTLSVSMAIIQSCLVRSLLQAQI